MTMQWDFIVQTSAEGQSNMMLAGFLVLLAVTFSEVMYDIFYNIETI